MINRSYFQRFGVLEWLAVGLCLAIIGLLVPFSIRDILSAAYRLLMDAFSPRHSSRHIWLLLNVVVVLLLTAYKLFPYAKDRFAGLLRERKRAANVISQRKEKLALHRRMREIREYQERRQRQ